MTNEETWIKNFEALKAHVAKTGHFPDKHTALNNWVKYQRKRMKSGLMTEEQQRMFQELAESRSGEHTGGRRKSVTLQSITRLVQESTEITPFQRKVYLELLKVPAGETITYGELARRIGCKSAQAVGQALKKNPFAPEVPCHRVIAKDGRLCGYFGHRSGPELNRKQLLLDLEKKEP